MENKSVENEKPRETVILVLKAERFEVDKQKLINKSQYFAALLSTNYLERRQTNHIINYEISRTSLQAFIDWIHNDTLDTSATSCDFEEFHDVLTLLELSFLFAADNLLEFVTDRLEKHYMLPKYALNIWLFAQELNVMLRDLSLAVCLDAFSELPPSSIYELSRENFLKLIGNINIRSTKSYVLDITHEWMNRNNDFTVSLDIIQKKKANILYSIISSKRPYDINNEHFIHCWDGNDFFELVSFNYPKDITDRSTGKNMLVGMQTTGRAYDLYLCGGEFGIGSGKFNKNVWRFSLISKKWYIQTVMPVERRHMVTVFLNDKLLLLGGTGKYRQKLQSVDVYDIYTGIWTSGAKVPFYFTSVPEHYIFDEKLIIYNTTTIHIYYSDKDVWQCNELCVMSMFDYPFVPEELRMITLESCYIDIVCYKYCDLISRSLRVDKMVFKTITELCNRKDCKDFEISCSSIPFKYEITSPTHSVTYLLYRLYGLYSEKNCIFMLVCTDRSSINKLHMHRITIQNINKFGSLYSSHSPRRFFHLLNSAFLHTTNLDHI